MADPADKPAPGQDVFVHAQPAVASAVQQPDSNQPDDGKPGDEE